MPCRRRAVSLALWVPMRHLRNTLLVCLLSAAGILAASGPARGRPIPLAPPGEREFIVDQAGLIVPPDDISIRRICDRLLTDKATPIIVVTIRSMSGVDGGRPVSIEAFARMLFNQWGIGHLDVHPEVDNRGILLLVSMLDRKARIELGAGWEHDADSTCRRIMDDYIIPRFKRGDYSTGITAGVEALDKMARGLKVPRPPRPRWHYALMVGAVCLVVFTVVSIARHGSNGWAWLFWGAVFGVIFFILSEASRAKYTSSGSSFGGGFSGGSFGGGFSGGGGATGSW